MWLKPGPNRARYEIDLYMGLIELNLVDVLATALAMYINSIKNRGMPRKRRLALDLSMLIIKLGWSEVLLSFLFFKLSDSGGSSADQHWQVTKYHSHATHPRKTRICMLGSLILICLLALMVLLGVYPFLARVKPANNRHLFPISACAHLKSYVHQQQIDLKRDLTIYPLRLFWDFSSASLASATLHNAAIPHSIPPNDDRLA